MSEKRRGRGLREDEDELWRGVVRSVKPLHRARVIQTPESETTMAPVKPQPLVAEREIASAPVRAAPARPPALATLDRRTKQKLVRGRAAIDARLDLHGMTQTEAYGALLRFLHRAQADGTKFVIVVTGKGARSALGERGVLRRQVPQWLSLPDFRSLVVGFESAHIGHGGEGALYVRVRRGR